MRGKSKSLLLKYANEFTACSARVAVHTEDSRLANTMVIDSLAFTAQSDIV